MNPRIAPAALLLAMTLPGCTSPPKYDPFQVPKEQFHATVETIAIAEVTVPDGLENPAAVKRTFEDLIVAKLEGAGFQTVPSDEVRAVWDHMQSQLGGLYDPMTGTRDDAKFEAARQHALDELAARFEADALLHPAVAVVAADFASGTARWCGASQGMESTGRFVLEALAGVSTSGTIQATCLQVVIEDVNGTNLYLDAGGIEVLGRLVAGGFEARPPDELFTDPERNRGAVDLAFDALARPAVATGPAAD